MEAALHEIYATLLYSIMIRSSSTDKPSSVFCRCIFTGTVVVIPDIAAISAPGDKAESRRKAGDRGTRGNNGEGLRGIKALGVRDLSYRLAFLANSVQVYLGLNLELLNSLNGWHIAPAFSKRD